MYFTQIFFPIFLFLSFHRREIWVAQICAKFCHYMNHENSPGPSLTPTFLPWYICQRQILTLCGATDTVIMWFERGRDGESRNHLLFIKEEQNSAHPTRSKLRKAQYHSGTLGRVEWILRKPKTKISKKIRDRTTNSYRTQSIFFKNVKIETIF